MLDFDNFHSKGTLLLLFFEIFRKYAPTVMIAYPGPCESKRTVQQDHNMIKVHALRVQNMSCLKP